MPNYLYGTEELPRLDIIEEYPHVLIDKEVRSGDGMITYYARCSKTSLTIKESSSTPGEFVLYGADPYISYYFRPSTDESWIYGSTNNYGGTFLKYINPIWSSCTIYNLDGSVYYEKSPEPVPVEDGGTIPLVNYNGVYLPKLPNDRLPYVTIVHMTGTDTYRAIFSTNAMVIREVDDPQVMTWNSDDDISVYAYTQGSSDNWTIDNTDTDHVYAGEIWYYETYNAEWVWSNTDILDENSNLIYDNPDAGVTAPTKPTSGFDLRSWLAMYLMGRCGTPLE